MQFERSTQVKTITEKDSTKFDELVNEYLQKVSEAELHWNNIEGSLSVTIMAKVTRRIIETLADEYEARGEQHYCIECKFYQPLLNKDGTPDKRCKTATCSHCSSTVWNTKPACDFFYEMLEAGENIFKEN